MPAVRVLTRHVIRLLGLGRKKGIEEGVKDVLSESQNDMARQGIHIVSQVPEGGIDMKVISSVIMPKGKNGIRNDLTNDRQGV